jgi:hypothetical protein
VFSVATVRRLSDDLLFPSIPTAREGYWVMFHDCRVFQIHRSSKYAQKPAVKRRNDRVLPWCSVATNANYATPSTSGRTGSNSSYFHVVRSESITISSDGSDAAILRLTAKDVCIVQERANASLAANLAFACPLHNLSQSCITILQWARTELHPMWPRRRIDLQNLEHYISQAMRRRGRHQDAF